MTANFETDQAPPADAATLNGLDLAGLTAELQPPAGWTRENSERKSIAASLGLDSAVWTMQQKAERLDLIDARRHRQAVDAIRRLPAPLEYLHVVVGAEFSGF